VLGESRTVPVRKDVMEDRFSEYQIHIYKLAFAPNRR
jgi:hypothetical protein